MEDIQVVHRYRTLANRGAVDSLDCRGCHGDTVLRVNAADEPYLICYRCDSKTMIGLKMIMQMERAVEEYDRNRA